MCPAWFALPAQSALAGSAAYRFWTYQTGCFVSYRRAPYGRLRDMLEIFQSIRGNRVFGATASCRAWPDAAVSSFRFFARHALRRLEASTGRIKAPEQKIRAALCTFPFQLEDIGNDLRHGFIMLCRNHLVNLHGI